MLLTPYASSSAGNLYEVFDGETRLLLECGLPLRALQAAPAPAAFGLRGLPAHARAQGPQPRRRGAAAARGGPLLHGRHGAGAGPLGGAHRALRKAHRASQRASTPAPRPRRGADRHRLPARQAFCHDARRGRARGLPPREPHHARAPALCHGHGLRARARARALRRSPSSATTALRSWRRAAFPAWCGSAPGARTWRWRRPAPTLRGWTCGTQSAFTFCTYPPCTATPPPLPPPCGR